MNYGVALTKVVPTQFAEDFLNGDLFLNTCAYFSELDKTDVVKAEPNDGIFAARQASEVAVQSDDGNWLPIESLQCSFAGRIVPVELPLLQALANTSHLS
jgi:hypothetical protein